MVGCPCPNSRASFSVGSDVSKECSRRLKTVHVL